MSTTHLNETTTATPEQLVAGLTDFGRGRSELFPRSADQHHVTLVGTETEKAVALAAELCGDVRAGRVGDPLAGDVIVLAVWFGSVDDFLAHYGDQLNGKVVVDITNPIDIDAFEPLELAARSAAQEIAEGTVAGQPLDVLIASDDQDAKATVSSIVAGSGLRPIDVGPLKRAREIEALGYLHMAMQQPLEANYSSAVKVLS